MLPRCSLGQKPLMAQRRLGLLYSSLGTALPQRMAVLPQASSTRRSSQFSSMNSQIKDIRGQMEENEQLRVMMAGLRGSNVDDSDFAQSNVRMALVEIQRDANDEDQLPLEYVPAEIAAYWGRRPVSVVTRILQLMRIGSGFLSSLAADALTGRLKETEVQRAIALRNIMTSLGPAYIKLGQALSIRPDLLSPPAMNELQKLCDKVPSFDSKVAMAMLEQELGKPWYEIYSELTAEPIAAASLGQVYRGRLKSGEEVAVKVQRPFVLETVTIDLYIIRQVGLLINRLFPTVTQRADIVALLDEWAARFFEELDYVREGQNALKFADQMRVDLPQVVVPLTFTEHTSRRVLTSQWLEGEKLSQSTADDVGDLVNIGVICFLKQLLETGFFHADPHPGNLIRTPDGRLAILDFGLMTQVNDDIKYGMIEAISHLIHRDYDAIVKDFVTLDFIPPETDLQPIVPVLARVFDTALEGGGAKNINFQELAADLAQITFDYPFRIPPYFALIIRAIGTLEGIALVGNENFALVDEAYPYISRRLLTDDSPRLREALRYMVYGRSGVFDADRLIDLLGALEDFNVNANSARGDMDMEMAARAVAATAGAGLPPGYSSTMADDRGMGSNGPASTSGRIPPSTFPFPFPFPPFPFPGAPSPIPSPALGLLSQLYEASPVTRLMGLPPASTFLNPDSSLARTGGFGNKLVPAGSSPSSVRESLRFMFSPEGYWFREFIMDELVKSIDAMSRDQLLLVVRQLGLEAVVVPVLLPGASRAFVPLAPTVSDEDRQVVMNIAKLVNFLSKGDGSDDTVEVGNSNSMLLMSPASTRTMLRELLPILPSVAVEILPDLGQRLVSRVSARFVREVYLKE